MMNFVLLVTVGLSLFTAYGMGYINGCNIGRKRCMKYMSNKIKLDTAINQMTENGSFKKNDKN